MDFYSPNSPIFPTPKFSHLWHTIYAVVLEGHKFHVFVTTLLPVKFSSNFPLSGYIP